MFCLLFNLHGKQIKFVRLFFGRIYGSPICCLKLTDLYYGSNKSTGKEISRTHLCALCPPAHRFLRLCAQSNVTTVHAWTNPGPRPGSISLTTNGTGGGSPGSPSFRGRRPFWPFRPLWQLCRWRAHQLWGRGETSSIRVALARSCYRLSHLSTG